MGPILPMLISRSARFLHPSLHFILQWYRTSHHHHPSIYPSILACKICCKKCLFLIFSCDLNMSPQGKTGHLNLMRFWWLSKTRHQTVLCCLKVGLYSLFLSWSTMTALKLSDNMTFFCVDLLGDKLNTISHETGAPYWSMACRHRDAIYLKGSKCLASCESHV